MPREARLARFKFDSTWCQQSSLVFCSMIAKRLATNTGKHLVLFFMQQSTAVESVQKIKTTGRSNSAFYKQDKRMARTTAVNSNLGIDTNLIKKRTKDKFFCINYAKIRTCAVRKQRCFGEAMNLIASSSYLGKTLGNPKLT